MKKLNKMIIKTILLSMALMLTAVTTAQAEVAIIVHPSNNQTLTTGDIARIYLGKTRYFPDGSDVKPFDLKEGLPVRVAFLKAMVGKSESQMKTYWSRLIFSGNGIPPKVAADDDEVKKWVSENKEGLGFIDVISVDESIKVIKTIQ